MKGPCPVSRLGVIASRRVGNAVVRNRVKRLFREAFRRHKDFFPRPYDLVLRARPTAAKANYRDMVEALRSVAERLG